LQDVLGANVAQPQQSSFSAGGLPPSRYGGDAPVAYSGQPTQTGTNGYDPTFDARLNNVNRINAGRYDTGVGGYNTAGQVDYGIVNGVRQGPYDTASTYADYNQVGDMAPLSASQYE
jgi:hypothetical protein